MINVDVVCEAEHLPRIKLLQTHMRSLNVELQILESVPETCSDRLLIVPRKRNSELAALDVPEDCERIALLLDEQTEPIEADMQVTLHSWPARSSDRHVETLARHLHTSRRKLSDEDIRSNSAADQQVNNLLLNATPSAVLAGKRAERRKNVLTLILLGIGVVALVSLLESEPQQVDKQAETDIEQPQLVEQADTAEPIPVPAPEKSSAPIPVPAQQHRPEIVVIDETGARVSQANVPRMCSQQDLQDGLRSEPCRLVLF